MSDYQYSSNFSKLNKYNNPNYVDSDMIMYDKNTNKWNPFYFGGTNQCCTAPFLFLLAFALYKLIEWIISLF